MNYLFDNTSALLNPLTIQTLVAASGLVLLGVYGLIREQGSQVSVVFFVLTLSMCVWLFAFAWMYNASDVRLAMWWAKVGYVGIICIPAAVYHFSSLILLDYEKVRKRVLAAWMLSACFITLILTTNVMFGALELHTWGYYPRLGLANIPFIIYFFSVTVITLRSFATEYRKARKGTAQKQRSRTLLIAMSTGYLAALDFIASFGVPWYPFGFLAVFVFIILAARSISRYRFMAITPAFAARPIIDTMTDALLVLDPDGDIRLVNRATCDLFGCQEQELIGKRPKDSMLGNSAFAGFLEAISKGGDVRNSEVVLDLAESPRRTLSLSVSTMRSPAGEPLAVVCVAGDISDRKRAEEDREKLIVQLKEANQKLQAMDKMKSDFISVVSHELRTPLTTIKAFVELVIMKPSMPEQQKMKLMSTINIETDRLARLIADLLDLARIEAGSMKWRLEQVSVEDLIRDVLASMSLLFEQKNLRVTTSFPATASNIFGDRDRLVQVMTNILSNAAKFTQPGGAIRITAHWEPAPVPLRIVVQIADTGMGIPADELESIFEKFHRSNDLEHTAIEGTGLGLAIARQIVEFHNGRIWAASTPGSGSVFTVTLPLADKGAGAGS